MGTGWGIRLYAKRGDSMKNVFAYSIYPTFHCGVESMPDEPLVNFLTLKILLIRISVKRFFDSVSLTEGLFFGINKDV